MELRNLRTVRLLLIVTAVLGFGATLLTWKTQGDAYQRASLPHDWTHRHLIFSWPSSYQHALHVGQDARFWQQLNRRFGRHHSWIDPWERGRKFRSGPPEQFLRDWGVSLGANATVGDGMFPAKFSFDVNAAPDCVNDYVVFTTGLAGSSSSPSVVAFNELYSGTAGGNGVCGTGGPSVYWAYNTNAPGDTTGKTLSSPTLSRDGTKVAFVESSNAAGTAVLHILRWHAGEGGTIAAPVNVTNSLPAGQPWSDTGDCPASASCMSSISFTGTNPDTLSAPFVDYHGDVLYVGDDNGLLHKFTGVFNGTPMEVTSSWPITVHSGFILTGPVFDQGSGNIFVGDGNGRLSFVRDTASVVGSCASGSPPCLGSNTLQLNNSLLSLFSNPIVDPPTVDSSTGRVFAFIGNDGALLGAAAQVAQADTQLSAGSVVTVGVGVPGANLHSGDFDAAYLNSASPSISGHMYICGKASGVDSPTLYRIGFNGTGVMNGSLDAGSLAIANFVGLGNGPECSSITELENGTTDRIFFSVANNGIVANGCTGGLGCVMSVVIPTSSPFTFPSTIAAALPEPGGTSGIIIDNVGSGAQESNFYFTPLSNSTAGISCNGTTGVGCAVKLTQSGLL